MLSYLERLGAAIARVFNKPLNTSAAIIMGGYTLLWGLWLVSPWWDVFNRAPLYSWLEDVVPYESFWGGVAICVGLAIIGGVVENTYRALLAGAFLGWLHWEIISVGYFLGDWRNTGGITAMMIAAYCAFVYLNVRVNRDNLHFEKEKGTL